MKRIGIVAGAALALDPAALRHAILHPWRHAVHRRAKGPPGEASSTPCHRSDEPPTPTERPAWPERSSPVRAAADARRRLAAMARPAGSFDASRYFRGTVRTLGFYNIGTGVVRRMAREIVAQQRTVWSIDDTIAFADILIRAPHLEAKGLGEYEAVARCSRELEPRHLRIFKRWLAGNYSANWATTDAICGSLIGPLLIAHPRLVPEVAAWSRHPNMWVRRTSAVGVIPSARKGLALPVAYGVAKRLHADSGI